MAFNLRNRNFLKLLDFSPKEIQFLLDLSADLKKAKYAGTEQKKTGRQKHRFDLRESLYTYALCF